MGVDMWPFSAIQLAFKSLLVIVGLYRNYATIASNPQVFQGFHLVVSMLLGF